MYGFVPLLKCRYSCDTGQIVCFDTASSMRLVKVLGLDKTRLNAAQRTFGEVKSLSK